MTATTCRRTVRMPFGATRSCSRVSSIAIGLALYFGATSGAVAQVGSPAQSETADTDQTASTATDVVHVIGTRVVRDGYDAPTPTTVVGNDVLERRAPLTLVDALTSIPAFRQLGTSGTATQAVTSNAGQSFVNLRGLGPNRTLVLIDGQRVVPSTTQGTVDIATFPTALLERVDVVTGGASASWGSDAVAGVVNFVLDRDFQGWKGKLQGGVSDEGDGENITVSLAHGRRFFEDRLSLIVSGEYYRNEGVEPQARSFAGNIGDYTISANPAFSAGSQQPRLLVAPYNYFNAPFAGYIGAGPLRGTTFNPDGSVSTSTYAPCLPTTTSSTAIENCGSVREDGRPWTTAITYLQTPQQRDSGYARLSYDVSDDVEIWGDMMYGRSRTEYQTVWPTSVVSGPYSIRADNAFLPTSLSTALATSGQPSFLLNKSFEDIGTVKISRENETVRYVAGADIDLGNSWTSTFYIENASNKNDFILGNLTNRTRFLAALDAVAGPNGTPICRSTLTSPGNGCVATNPLSSNGRSPAELAYFQGTSVAALETKQQAAALNIAGDLFELPAGAVSIAFGTEFRKESAQQTVDPVSAASGWVLSNPKPLRGEFDVTEFYGETVVPVIRDAPLVHSLDVSAAGRATNYSTSGPVETWKLGLNYEPIEELRLRVTRSRDIRAPNIIELFSSAVQGTASVIDPRTTRQATFQGFTLGNPELQPEIADTLSAGIVYRPDWLPDASFSIDGYSIKVVDAIGTLPNQDIVNRCEAGATVLCSLVTRDADGVITTIRNQSINLRSIETNGADIEASYRTDLTDISSALSGTLTLRAIASYVGKFDTNDGVRSLDQAGSVLNGQAHWGGDLTAIYEAGSLSASLNWVYLGGGAYDNQYVTSVDINDNEVKSLSYLNAGIEYATEVGSGKVVYFANANNIFDVEPPVEFPVNGGNYDRVGRRFVGGIRFQF